MSVKRITENFHSEAGNKIMQAAIDDAEARGEVLTEIILSTPFKPSEILGEEGFLLVFRKREELSNDCA